MCKASCRRQASALHELEILLVAVGTLALSRDGQTFAAAAIDGAKTLSCCLCGPQAICACAGTAREVAALCAREAVKGFVEKAGLDL